MLNELQIHTVNLSSDMIETLYISGKKDILVYSCIQKQGKKKNDFLHYPFEPPANYRSRFGPLGWIGCASWLVAQKDNV